MVDMMSVFSRIWASTAELVTLLSGPVPRDIGILLLQYPISRNTFSVGSADPKKRHDTPPWCF